MGRAKEGPKVSKLFLGHVGQPLSFLYQLRAWDTIFSFLENQEQVRTCEIFGFEHDIMQDLVRLILYDVVEQIDIFWM